MFLREFLRKRADRMAAEDARKLQEQEERKKQEEWNKKYWEISKYLYKAIRSTAREMDNTLGEEITGGYAAEIHLTYHSDKRLFVKIRTFFPKDDDFNLMAYEATFYIDGVKMEVDLEKYTDLGIILCEDLKKKADEYKNRKSVLLEDYQAWKGHDNSGKQEEDK